MAEADLDAEEIDLLLARARAGDDQAFHRVVVAVAPAVRLVVAAHASEPLLVEEMTQLALARAWEQLDRYEARGTFVAWVRSIARNELRMELRSRSRRQARARRACDPLDAVVIDAQLAALEEEEAAERRERAVVCLRDCLTRLPDRLRQLVEAHHIEGRPLSELAASMGRSTNWVAVNLHRVRSRLADCVRHEVGDEW